MPCQLRSLDLSVMDVGLVCPRTVQSTGSSVKHLVNYVLSLCPVAYVISASATGCFLSFSSLIFF